MTCAAGIHYQEDAKSIVIIGCDSCTVSDGILEERMHPKICKVSNEKHDYLLVASGSGRKNDLLQTFVPPVYEGGDLMMYMITSFVTKLRKIFKDGWMFKIENGREIVEGHTLVGFQGRLFQISMDFHVSEHDETAIGSGREAALASLYTSQSIMLPAQRVTRALETAARFDPYVAGPFHVLSSQNDA